MYRWITDDYLDTEEARREAASDFVEEYCSHCKHLLDGDCVECFGDGYYFEEE